MSIPTQCPKCTRRFAAPDQLLGKGVKCPQCSNQFIVQATSTHAPSAPAGMAQSRPATVSPAADGEEGARKFPVKNILIGVGALVFSCLFLYLVISLLSGGGTWQVYDSKDGGFTVLMPGSPSPQDKSPSPVIHSALNFKEISLPQGSSTFSVHYYDLKHKPINDYLISTNSMHRLISEKSGKLSHELPAATGTYQGREFVIEVPSKNQMVARRVFLANARVYWVTAEFPKADALPPEVERFLASFKITQPPPMPEATLASLNQAGGANAAPPPVETPAAKKEPPVAKNDPKGGQKTPPRIKADFPISEEEQVVVELINAFRAAEKAQPLKVERRLFDGARQEANLATRGQQRNSDYGYRNYFRITMPGRDVTPQQIVEQLTDPRSKNTRVQVADEAKQDIGVGVASANGVTYYVILMCADPF